MESSKVIAMNELKQFYEKNKDFIMEIIHFGIVGVINTLMGWVIIKTLYNVIHLHYWVSTGISYFIGGVFSYFANSKVTFKVDEQNKDKGLPWRFAMNLILCYLIAYGVAKPLVKRVLSEQPVATVENNAINVGVVLFIVMNYFGQKFFVFRKVRKEERDSHL